MVLAEGSLAARIELGARLFVDSTLSVDSTMSCATCHIPSRAFTESLAVSKGIGPLARRRNTPTLINLVLSPDHFDWDGRASTLSEQLLGVFSRKGDMGIDLPDVIHRLQVSLRHDSAFRRVFNRPADSVALLSALTAFQESLIERDSRFSRYYLGGDSTMLSISERRGFQVFRTVGCAGCHPPLPDPRRPGVIMFSDTRFHNLGVGYISGRMKDLGRYEVTSRPEDWGSFKTPSLHNVSRTAPYMHDGSLQTLEAVVDFYDRGGIRNPNLDPVMVRRHLTPEQRKDLVAFLGSLETTDSSMRRVGTAH